MVLKCVVSDCRNTSKEAVLHTFPYLDEKVYNEWLRRLQIQVLFEVDPRVVYTRYRLCDKHFENCRKFPGVRNRTNLKPRSLPTLHLPGFNGDPSMENYYSMSYESSVPKATSEPMLLMAETCATETCATETCAMETCAMETCAVGTSAESHHEDIVYSSPTHGVGTEVIVSTPSLKRSDIRKKLNLLHSVGVNRPSYLTPKARRMYKIARNVNKSARRAFKELEEVRSNFKDAVEYATNCELLKEKVNKTTFNFILSQIKNQSKEPKGRRFSLDDKILALSLMKQSPQAYRLWRTQFALPAQRTLSKLLAKVPFECGLNDKIFNTLKISVMEMAAADRYCVLMFDEISLTPMLSYNCISDKIEGFAETQSNREKIFADHAMVFMIKGIRKSWKQPIAYYFTESGMKSDTIQTKLVEVITKLQEIGLVVVATVCDQYKPNEGAYAKLIETTNKKYAEMGKENRNVGFEVNGKEIVNLYDPPHLLKCLRNNFLDNEVEFRYELNRMQLAKWDHIRTFYERDASMQPDYRMCSSLSDTHIYKAKLKIMKVKVSKTCQVLRHFLPIFCLEGRLCERLNLMLDKFVFNEELFQCEEHNLKSFFLNIHTPFYVRNWVKTVNGILTGSRLTQNYNDPIKKIALIKYRKTKGKNKKIRQMKGLQ